MVRYYYTTELYIKQNDTTKIHEGKVPITTLIYKNVISLYIYIYSYIILFDTVGKG